MNNPTHSPGRLGALILGAAGVVYGDIGTSPLYALRESFAAQHGVALTPANIVGIVSLMLWALIIVVSLKYVVLILRADNRGEGGVMAMIALATSSVGGHARRRAFVILLGLFGAALFFGEGVITPAISVLSAVEGLEVATPAVKPFVVPLAITIITALYWVQRHGTGRIGGLFGPIMLIWFAVLAVLGVINITRAPDIVEAFNPANAAAFMLSNGWIAFAALGAVVLCITGAEALYADLGHFGHKAIRTAWFVLVFPALALSYLGQGALLLTDPATIDNPFFKQAPVWAVLPLVALATAATVIASQATISGTFSLVRQAIQLGYLPRMTVVQTSAAAIGQVYIPAVNWLQYTLVIGAVVAFGSSSKLAAAYGIAVTGTMMINTLLTFFVIRFGWKLSLPLCIAATGFFFLIDLAFFSANMLKLLDGGWFPLVMGIAVYVVMLTWKQGRNLLRERMRRDAIPLETLVPAVLQSSSTLRVAGTAVFLRGETEGTPRAFMHNLSHNKVLHDRVVFVTVHTLTVPWVPMSERVTVTPLGKHCFQVDVNFGFKNEPDIPRALECCKSHGLSFDPMETSYFVSRHTVVPTLGEGMARWREQLFAGMVRNAADPAEFYSLPANRVVELGSQIAI